MLELPCPMSLLGGLQYGADVDNADKQCCIVIGDSGVVVVVVVVVSC